MSPNELKLLRKLCCSVISVINEQRSRSEAKYNIQGIEPPPLINVCILFLLHMKWSLQHR